MHTKETMEKKYNIIYADPPWRYDMNRGQGAAENHYPTMSIQEICRLPVAELAAKDCALFLWVTFPQLQDAMKLFEAWGFTYKTLGFAWVKQNKSGKGFFFGMGYWTRSNVEICLLMLRRRKGKKQRRIPSGLQKPLRSKQRRYCRRFFAGTGQFSQV